MNLFVINLDRRTDRLDSITQMLGALNLNFERVSAVDGQGINVWKHIDLWKTVFYHDLQMPNAGTIACYLSHRRVWEEIVSRNLSQAIVFEDDVIPVDFDPAILNVDLSEIGLDQLRLEEWDWKDPGRVCTRQFSLPVIGRQAVGTPTAGSGCYVISRAGAEKCLQAGKFWFTMDHFDIWERAFGLRTAILRPKMFHQSDSPSDISTHRRPTELLQTIIKDFVIGPWPGLVPSAGRLKRWVMGAADDVWILFRGYLALPPKRALLYYKTTKAEEFEKISAFSGAEEKC